MDGRIDASARAPDPTGAPRTPRPPPDRLRGAWRVLVVATVVGTFGSAPLGPDLQSLVVGIVALASVAAIVVGRVAHRPSDERPWVLLSWSGAIFLVGNVVRELTTEAVAGIEVADLFDLGGYALSIAGLHRMTRARSRTVDPTRLIDALIASGGIGVLVWVVVMVPYLRNPTLTITERALAVVFSLLSLTALTLVAQLAIGPGVRNPSYYLLAVAGLFTVVADTVTSVGLSVTGAELDWQPTAALSLSAISLGGLGASALHPSMARVTDESRGPVPEITPLRLTMMAAVLVAPAALAATTTAETRSTLVVVIAWAAMSVLVLVRLAGLVRARERSARHDRTLAWMVERFVGAGTVEEVLDLAADALAGSVTGHAVVSSFALDAAGWRAVSTRPDHSPAHGADHRAVVESALGAGPGSTAPVSGAVVRGDAVVAPVVAEGVVRGALVVDRAEPTPEVMAITGRIARETAVMIQSMALAAELHRQRGERRFRALVENSLDLVLVVDEDGRISFVSPSADRVLGRGEDELVGRSVVSIALDDDRDALGALVTRPIDGGGLTEIRCRRGDGSLGWFEAVASDMTAVAEVGGPVLTLRDVTERKAVARRLASSEARFRSLVQHSSDVVCVLDDAHFVSYVSPSVVRVLAMHPEELRDREIWALVEDEDEATLRLALATLAERDGDPARLELRVVDGRGGTKTLDVTVTDLRGEPAVGGIVLNAHDITMRKELETGLARQASHDDLTGLANRAHVRKRVSEALERRTGADGPRDPRPLAVMFIDLDDFKSVNDSYGHTAGDDLLRVVAERIRRVVRDADVAARLGGDEFAVIVEGLAPPDAVALAERVLTAVAEPVVIGGREQIVRAAIGIAFAGDDATTTTELLRNADTAMYAAKQRAPSRVEVFDEAMHSAVFERHELKRDLTSALERRELVVWYQPVIDLANGTVHGFEALLRWNHPTRGMVSPATFVPLAEESGLIVPITWWVLGEALDRLVVWRAATGRDDLVVNVNMAAAQLDESDVRAEVARALAERGLDPGGLVVELTESAEIEINSIDVLERLRQLRQLGVGLAADDFGAGYSSYANLQRIPYTVVKIDKSLIDGLADDRDADRARLQVRSIVEMAHAAGLAVVAEGVEHVRQSQELELLDCDFGQGYLFSRPLDSAKAHEYLVTSTVPDARRPGDVHHVDKT